MPGVVRRPTPTFNSRSSVGMENSRHSRPYSRFSAQPQALKAGIMLASPGIPFPSLFHEFSIVLPDPIPIFNSWDSIGTGRIPDLISDTIPGHSQSHSSSHSRSYSRPIPNPIPDPIPGPFLIKFQLLFQVFHSGLGTKCWDGAGLSRNSFSKYFPWVFHSSP